MGDSESGTKAYVPATTSIESSHTQQPLGKVGVSFSFVLVIAGMIGSIIAQKFAPKYINSALWTSDCPSGYLDVCISNGAVFRFSLALVLIFALQLIGTSVHIRFFDTLWIPKYFAFGCTVGGFFYVNSSVFDQNGYSWFARIAAFFYLILQQIILIDFAFTWNEKWVAKGIEGEGDGSGNKYFAGLLGISSILMAGSISAIGVMYWQFAGCVESNVIISLTLVLCFIATLIQIFCSTEGSLLTSAIISTYATYICYSAVSLNPDQTCNPTISTSYQTVSTAIGMSITVLSLIWATQTTIQKIPEVLGNAEPSLSVNIIAGSTAVAAAGVPGTASAPEVSPVTAAALRPILQEVSVVFILISCYYAMVLTNWATMQSSYNLASPKNGKVAMWLQACAIWIAVLLYIWSLFAPVIFPNREF